MKNDTLAKLETAKAMDKDEAAFAYVEIATELLSSDDELELAEIPMQLAINSYHKIEHESDEGLYARYFATVRHMDDHREITNTDFLTESIAPNRGKTKIFTYEANEIGQLKGKTGPYDLFVISAQGPREEMEDIHLFDEFLLENKQTVQLFAVLDGHGGIRCAEYVAKHLKEKITKHLYNFDDLSICNALTASCVELDEEWERKHQFRSGTTLSAALIINRDLWVFNVGDSRVVLADGKKTIQLSKDAKPTVEKFEKELIRRGSYVSNGRVEDSLDVARTIGDIEFPAVSARPTIRKFSLHEKPYTVILACDGFWDVVGSEEAVTHITHFTDLEKMGVSLKDLAYDKGCTDNLTLMLIHL